MTMPCVPLTANWEADEFAIVRRIVNTKTGEIRASRPEFDYEPYLDAKGVMRKVPNRYDGMAAFVWRMVVFIVGDDNKHHCLPVMAYFYLPIRDNMHPDDKEAIKNWGEALADKILNTIPKSYWLRGLSAWYDLI